EPREISSAGSEHLPYKQGVTGSNPVSPTRSIEKSVLFCFKPKTVRSPAGGKKDLINWKRTNLRFDKLSARFQEVGCVWAPEITYDEEVGKLMIYFTMRYRTEPAKLYYAYINEDFDRLESTPKVLFAYPDENITAIDADITKVGDKYRMFYVSHDGEAGIKQAVSDRANGGFIYDPRWYDPEPQACEAPNVWKRIGEDRWVLMYDCYGQSKHNFGFSETTDFVYFENIGHFNEGVM